MKFIIASFALLATCLANPVKDAAPKCGVPTIKPDVTKIVGGTDAIPYSWPWQVALFKGTLQFCAGTLISPTWIMTAGHCFYGDDKDPSKFQVKLGVFNKTDNNEPGEQVVKLSEIHVNPKFDPNKVTFDITLLKLKDAVTFTDHISPVCLPAKQDEALPDPGTSTVATGWGDIRYLGRDSVTLREVSVPLIDLASCKKSYPNQIYENVQFCAGPEEGGKGVCQGDSGGPLQYQDPASGVWKQLGITSWGAGCATPHRYQVYSKVSAYIDFIQQYVKDL